MRKIKSKQILAAMLSISVLAANTGFASAATPQDGMTKASETADAGANGYAKWEKEWENIKNDWTQISLTPGSDESQLNFAWYSLATDSSIPKLKIGKGKKMEEMKEYTAVQTDATKDEKNDISYKSNKVTVTGLEENTTYYYSYQINGKWSAVEKYQTQSAKKFSFIYVGDPQIGSSNSLKGEDTQEFYDAQAASVANDAFNWNVTLKEAMDKTNNSASFVLSAGDQIQTTKKKAPGKAAWVSEVEYAGYLSPDVLKSLSVATTVGNHDADNPNYVYHFNTPNSSEKGSNGIVGGDYWFTYGDALFMMLNTQDTNVAEHKQFMEEAIAANKDCKWRIVTLHQDIYGSAEHSNEVEITNLRYTLVPYFEANDVDVVLTGHDHAYSRSQILKGGTKSVEYNDDDFDAMLEKDVDAETDAPVFVTNGNIKEGTTDAAEKQYLEYIQSIMDTKAVIAATKDKNKVINPDGILYMTANSSSGSKYYDLVARKQSYIANRWQEDVPTYSIVDMTENTFTINTYRTDTNEKIDDTFTIQKGAANNDVTVTKADIGNVTVSGVKDKVYTGRQIVQKITAKSATGVTLKEGTDYRVSYKNNTKAGVASLVITGMGSYTGSKTMTFSIKPPKVTIKKLSVKGKSKVNIKFAKSKASVTGYQIQYAQNKKFQSAKKVTTKNSTCTIKKLKKGKTYYFRIRAYKTAGGKKIYGAFGAKKKVTVKK